MNFKQLLAGIALITLVTTFCHGMEKTPPSMEKKQYLIKSETGKPDAIAHKLIMDLISNTTLEQACKNIHALAHTNGHLHNLLNTEYNTNILVRELAARYTSAIHAAEALKTTGAAQCLLKNLNLINSHEALSIIRDENSYFSLLPDDLMRECIQFSMHKQSIPQLIEFLQTYAKARVISDNFRLIRYLATRFSFYKANREASHILAAQLLNTAKSTQWLALLKPEAKDLMAARYYYGNLLLYEFQDSQKAREILEKITKQDSNKFVKACAHLDLAHIYIREKSISSNMLMRDHIHAAYYQRDNEDVKQQAALLMDTYCPPIDPFTPYGVF